MNFMQKTKKYFKEKPWTKFILCWKYFSEFMEL